MWWPGQPGKNRTQHIGLAGCVFEANVFYRHHLGVLSNGKTSDFGSEDSGSNPGTPAIEKEGIVNGCERSNPRARMERSS